MPKLNIPKYIEKVNTVMVSGFKGLGFKLCDKGLILVSKIETSSLSVLLVVNGQGLWRPIVCIIIIIIINLIKKKSPLVDSSTWPLKWYNCSKN